MDNDNFDYLEENNSSNDILSDVKSGNKAIYLSKIWRRMSLKNKLIVIGCACSFIFIILFLIILITPLMYLEIIDMNDLSGFGHGGSIGSSYSSSSNLYWWPVGSNESEEKDGVIYASGQPYSTEIITNFNASVDSDSYHTGVDISSNGASVGVVNVIAAKPGEVIYPTDDSLIHFDDTTSSDNTDGDGYGNYVKIKHSDGSYTLYAHLSKDSITVKAGDVVSQGQVIGKMGSSGSASGTYLHFEVRIGSDSQSNAEDPLKYIDLNNTRPSNYATNDAFSVTTTVLSKNEFISRMNDYCTRSNNKNFCNNFSKNAGYVYDKSIANNVNPELVVVTAGTEQSWKNACGNNNYWGINVTNTGGGCGSSFSSLGDGIAAYGKLMNNYATKNAKSINSRYEQRKNANCDPAGHGQAGTLVGMQSIYSWIGNHRYNPGNAGRGGCYYLNIIYGKGYCSRSDIKTCGGNYKNCSDASKTTVCEQNDYTAWQVKKKIEMRHDIFGV